MTHRRKQLELTISFPSFSLLFSLFLGFQFDWPSVFVYVFMIAREGVYKVIVSKKHCGHACFCWGHIACFLFVRCHPCNVVSYTVISWSIALVSYVWMSKNAKKCLWILLRLGKSYSNFQLLTVIICDFPALHEILSTFLERIVLLMNKLIKMGVIFRNIPVGFHAPDWNLFSITIQSQRDRQLLRPSL